MTRLGHLGRLPLALLLLSLCPESGARESASGMREATRQEAAAYLESDLARVEYSWVTRATVEGVSWVRYIHAPAEYLLLGSPDLAAQGAIGLARGDPGLSVAKTVVTDVLLEMAKAAVEHPATASRKIAAWAYQRGLDAYRENYGIYRAYHGRPDAVTHDVAVRLLRNRCDANLMSIARDLYNEISAFERGNSTRSPEGRRAWLRLESDLARTASAAGARNGELAVVWVQLYRLIAEAHAGIAAYPPYQQYRKRAAKLFSDCRAGTDGEGDPCRAFRVRVVEGTLTEGGGRVSAFDSDGRLVWDGAFNRVLSAPCVDANRDGKAELFIEDYSGGAHCCFSYSMIALPEGREVFRGGGGDGQLVLADVDGDGRQEIREHVVLSYFGGLSFATSPGFDRYSCEANGRYTDCTKLFGDLLERSLRSADAALKESLATSRGGAEPEAWQAEESQKSASLLYLAIAMLLDREEEAWSRLERDLPHPIVGWLAENRDELREWVQPDGE